MRIFLFALVLLPFQGVFGQKPQNADSDFQAFELERLPVFPGGEKALAQFLHSNIYYPPDCEDITGLIAVSFLIDTLGDCSDWRVLRTPSKRCFQPVVDSIFWKMPCWEPGRLGGRAVPVRYTIPIRILLE
jgi:periplasmic protein TonB